VESGQGAQIAFADVSFLAFPSKMMLDLAVLQFSKKQL
jgi:hypothetical protein